MAQKRGSGRPDPLLGKDVTGVFVNWARNKGKPRLPIWVDHEDGSTTRHLITRPRAQRILDEAKRKDIEVKQWKGDTP